MFGVSAGGLDDSNERLFEESGIVLVDLLVWLELLSLNEQVVDCLVECRAEGPAVLFFDYERGLVGKALLNERVSTVVLGHHQF